jgi:hypothetical protein
MCEEYMALEPGRNDVLYVKRGIALIVARGAVCEIDYDYTKPLDDYEPKKVEICSKCSMYVAISFTPDLWP